MNMLITTIREALTGLEEGLRHKAGSGTAAKGGSKGTRTRKAAKRGGGGRAASGRPGAALSQKAAKKTAAKATKKAAKKATTKSATRTVAAKTAKKTAKKATKKATAKKATKKNRDIIDLGGGRIVSRKFSNPNLVRLADFLTATFPTKKAAKKATKATKKATARKVTTKATKKAVPTKKAAKKMTEAQLMARERRRAQAAKKADANFQRSLTALRRNAAAKQTLPVQFIDRQRG